MIVIRDLPRELLDEKLRDRFRAKYRIISASGCWEWTGYLGTGSYGHFYVGGRLAKAHRVSYELFVGPIPRGLELDHVCRNRWCVNPGHLEPVTHLENIRRGSTATKTECVNGHPFDEANTYYRPNENGNRTCRTCKNIRWLACRDRKRARALQEPSASHASGSTDGSWSTPGMEPKATRPVSPAVMAEDPEPASVSGVPHLDALNAGEASSSPSHIRGTERELATTHVTEMSVGASPAFSAFVQPSLFDESVAA